MTGRRWQIYGPTRGEGSWSRVAKGLVEGLNDCREDVTFFATDDIGHELDGALPPGFDADIGVFVGPPAHARMMRGQGQHTERWLMLAPNSTWLPKDALAELERTESVTGYLTPSAWGRSVIETYTTLPVRVWMHGVSRGSWQAARDAAEMDCQNKSGRLSRSAANWRALHLSSTQQDRKSTHALVRAFVQAVDDPSFLSAGRAHLTVVVDGPLGDVEDTAQRAAESDLGRQCVAVLERRNLSAMWMASYMADFDVVVQPSRAEGFGMVPLEARAAGVPVIMTDGTGHRAHVPTYESHQVQAFSGGYVTPDGVVVIRNSQRLERIDDGPGARAPTVAPEAIVAALEVACSWRHVLHPWASLNAQRVVGQWRWGKVTEQFLRTLVLSPEALRKETHDKS